MAGGVLCFLADRLTDPFLELWLREVVVIDPPLVASVVRGIDVDALDSSRVGRKKGLQGDEVVPFDNQIAVESGR